MQLQGTESSDYTDRSHGRAGPTDIPQLWMFIIVPSLDIPHWQGHNSGALWTEKCVQMRLPAGVFGHGTRRCSPLTGNKEALISDCFVFGFGFL